MRANSRALFFGELNDGCDTEACDACQTRTDRTAICQNAAHAHECSAQEITVSLFGCVERLPVKLFFAQGCRRGSEEDTKDQSNTDSGQNGGKSHCLKEQICG